MRQHVDADTEFTDLAGPFEHLDLYTDPLQEEGRGQSPDAAASDQCFHRFALQSGCQERLPTARPIGNDRKVLISATLQATY